MWMSYNIFTSLCIVMPQSSMFVLLVADFTIQWVCWLIASLLHTEKFYDLAGSFTFVLNVSLCYGWHSIGHPRQVIQTGAVLVWAIRLGLFLFVRIMVTGKDRRFDKIRDQPLHFFFVWTLQGIWIFMSLLPTLLCLMISKQPELGLRDYIGWTVWLLGFVIETIADYQKSAFRRDPNNESKFISSGLWSLSRHPNYLGEIMLWFGLYISASSTFKTYEYLTVFCPAMTYLGITQVTGIPILEKYGIKKWGASPQYLAYVRRTPVLVPFRR